MYPEIDIFGYHMQTKTLAEALGSAVAVFVTMILLYFRFVKGRFNIKSLILYVAIPDALVPIVFMSLGTLLGRYIRGMTHPDNGGFLGIAEALDYGGMHFVGRVLAMAIVLPIVFRFLYKNKKDDSRYVLDVLAFFIPIQHIGNRLGCFFNGCCYGKPYNGAISVKFPDEVVPYRVFPSQLFEVACMVILLILIIIIYAKKWHTFEMTLIGFAISILISEKYIDKVGVISYNGMTAIQYASVLLIIIAIIFIVANSKIVKGEKKNGKQ